MTPDRLTERIRQADADTDPRRAVRALEQVLADAQGAPDKLVADVWNALVRAAAADDDEDTYARILGERAAWADANLGASDPMTLQAWVERGAAADERGDLTSAAEAWEHGSKVALPPEATDLDRNRLSRALRGLGIHRLREGDPGAARDLFQRDLDLNRAFRKPNDPFLANLADNLAAALERTGDRELAKKYRKVQVKLLEGAYGPDHPLVSAARKRLAALE